MNDKLHRNIKEIQSKEWIMVYRSYHTEKCQSPSLTDPCTPCGKLGASLRLRTKEKYKKMFFINPRYVCPECAKQNYKIVGLWAKLWEKDLKNEK